MARSTSSGGLTLDLGLGLASQGSLTSSTTTTNTASASSSQWNAALSSVVAAAAAGGDRQAAAQAGRASTSPESGAAGAYAGGVKRGLERTGSGVSRAGTGSDEEDGGDGAGGRGGKKLRLSKDQAAVLEECFKTHSTLNPKQKTALANRLGLRPRQVEVWFQNRRARTKLKQTEVDCEYLKRWCERLAEENKRLEKEVADLRALNAAPAAAAQAHPSSSAAAATLTMCPSCRRVAATTSGPTPTPPPNHQQQCHPKSNTQSPSAAGNVLPSHCQFFPAAAAADRTRQSTWNAVAAPLVTRELF